MGLHQQTEGKMEGLGKISLEVGVGFGTKYMEKAKTADMQHEVMFHHIINRCYMTPEGRHNKKEYNKKCRKHNTKC